MLSTHRTRLVAAVLSLVLLLGVLAGCGGAKQPAETKPATPAATPAAPAAKKPVELTFSMMEFANEVPGWTAAIEAANKQLEPKGIKIKIQTVPGSWPDYYQKNVAQMAAGQSADIGRIAESYMPVVINKGQVVDLTTYINDLDKSKYFMATFQNAAFQKGKYYGIPSGVYYELMFYNKDLFDKAGVKYPSADWTKPNTFAEVRDMAKKLTKGEGASKTFGLSAGPYMAFIGQYTKSNGGDNVFRADGTCALTDAPSLEVYRWFDDMLRSDYSMPRPTDTKVAGPLEMFKAGRLGMWIEGSWMLPAVRDIKNIKVGIAALPAGKGGKAYSSQFVDSWIIWKGTKYEKESWEALKALYSAEAMNAVAAKGVGGLPVMRETVTANLDQFLGPQFSAQDKDVLIKGLDYTLAVPYNENYQEIDQKVNAGMDEWLLGKITAEQYATKVCEVIKANTK